MRILFLCTSGNLSGAPLHVKTLIDNLSDEFETLFVCGQDGEVTKALRTNGVKVVVVQELNSAAGVFSDVRAFSKIFKEARIFDPTVLHLHSAKAGMVGRLVALVLKRPWVYTVHGWGWRGFSAHKRFLIMLVELALSLIPKGELIFVARDVQQKTPPFMRRFASGRLIHNGVPDVFDLYQRSQYLPSDRLKIITAARVDRSKDHQTLLLGCKESLLNNCELILCGEGTDGIPFKKMASNLLEHRGAPVSFIGQTSKYMNLLYQSDIFVLCSHFEALPLSIIEAMAAGLPIIATEVGGVGELIDHSINGYLISPGDYNALANYLEKLQDPRLRSKLGGAAREKYLSEFSVHKMLTEVRAVYELSKKQS